MAAMSSTILCSTARLARSLRAVHARDLQQGGSTVWRPLPVTTLAQWQEHIVQQAMLRGHLSPHEAPVRLLGGMAERLVWESVINNSLKDNALFDVAGMAQSAQEANLLMQAWGVHFPDAWQTEETRQFLRWRAAFRAACAKLEALEETRFFELAIRATASVPLPPRIAIAGFDRISPQEEKLFEAMRAQGCEVQSYAPGLRQSAVVVQTAFDEAEAECRAAVAWAQARLQQNPQGRLAIVVPELAKWRSTLQDLLDDALHPASIHPAQAEMHRLYDFSLGAPLVEVPIIATALALLRLACLPQLTQQESGRLLRDPYWSASQSEADARARLEAVMRRKLPATITLDQFIRFAKTRPHFLPGEQELSGVSKLVQHLEALQQKSTRQKNTAPGWVQLFAEMLEAAHWPGERSLSSVEFQARQAWHEALQVFAELGDLLGRMDAARALRQFTCLLRERIFQPEAIREPRLVVMGMLEAAAEPLDGVWVLGMNDHLWPPPARVNPLLPAEAQRIADAPNSCSRVQAAFARSVHQRLLQSAPEVVFSWARKDGERELRPSPLLQDMPLADGGFSLAQSLPEQLAQPQPMQWISDVQAPPVAEGEKVRGGAQLFRAQAICPAWGYYQYRLGARALETPVDGLDGMARGSLLHAVLQAFWQGRDAVWLQDLDETCLQQAIAQAVESGVAQYTQMQEQALPPHFLALEKRRLATLLHGWVALERARPLFTVQDCERRVNLDIHGVNVEFTLDRVDALQDGALVVLDYKTGAQLDQKSWARDRISEPQLPIYAALVLRDASVAAVCFARVRAGEHAFIGVAQESEVLPGVKGLEDARRWLDAEKFPHWESLLQHWRDSLEGIAAEIKKGMAAVSFEDEAELAYCEVKPLLRLPERKLQMERGRPV